MNVAEETLAAQLDQAGIPYEREYVFAPEEWCRANGFLTPKRKLPRKWRADFFPHHPNLQWAVDALNEDRKRRHPQLDVEDLSVIGLKGGVLVEIDGGGYVAGRHSRGKGMEDDAEKQSAAAILGYRVIRATPKQVENGTALAWIRQALGLEVAA